MLIQKQVGLLILLLSIGRSSLATPPFDNSDPCKNMPDRSVSISVGFQYGGDLPGTKDDADSYDRMSANFTDNKVRIGDADVTSKRSFLDKLRQAAAQSEYVNFNYAGHGVYYKGRWSMPLPGYENCHCYLLQNSGFEPVDCRGGPKCSDPSQFFVSDQELRQALNPGGDKKILAIIDACHSGGADLGAGSEVISSASADQLAGDGSAIGANGKNHGAFTHDFIGMMNRCESDTNSDGVVDGDELMKRFLPTVLHGGSSASSASGGATRGTTRASIISTTTGEVIGGSGLRPRLNLLDSGLPALASPLSQIRGGTTNDQNQGHGNQTAGLRGDASAPWMKCFTLTRPRACQKDPIPVVNPGAKGSIQRKVRPASAVD